jgi:hypothetical protein
LLLASCGYVEAEEANRTASVRANERLLRQLPSFSGAQLVGRRTGSWKVQTGPDEWTTTSYVLKVVYATPGNTTADDVVRFYRRQPRMKLRTWGRRPQGWPEVCCETKGRRSIPHTTCFQRRRANVCVDTTTFMRDGKIVRGARYVLTLSAGDPTPQ